MAAWTIAGGAVAAPASAGSFKINPVQVTLTADAKAASLTITNADLAPVSVHATALGWTQPDGRDLLSPAPEVIISPPIFTIAPGQSQLVRVGLRARGSASAYRLIFEEIPRGQPAQGQIQVNLRLNLPLYLVPAGASSARLEWHAFADHSGALVIEGRNLGGRHARITGIDAPHNGTTEPLSRAMGDILPGSRRRWEVGKHPSLNLGQPLDLILRGPSGESHARVAVEQR